MKQGSIVGFSQGPSTRDPWLLSVLRRYPLLFFFFIACTITWGINFTFTIVSGQYKLSFWMAFLLTLGPTCSAFIMTAVTEGRVGVGNLLRRFVLWRVGLVWYLLVLVGVPLLLMLAAWFMPGGWQHATSLLLLNPVVYLILLFLGGPFFEEPGWRGFALPHLQERMGPLWGSVLLGILWGLWRLPGFFLSSYYETGFIGIGNAMLVYFGLIIGVTILFTWVSNNTRGSLLIAFFLHASLDTSGNLGPSSIINQFILCAVIAIPALIIIIVTRGRLSYDRYKCETGSSTMKV